MTALMTSQQSQGFADRAGLVSSVPGAPSAAGSADGTSSALAEYSTMSQLQSQVFDSSFSDLMLVTTALTGVAVLLALLLPSGRPSGGDGHRVVEA
jgi:hypothetical protein